jgi:hypothetical protein
VVRLLARTLRGDVSAAELDAWSPEDLAAAAAEHGVDLLVWQAVDRTTSVGASLRAALDSRMRAAVAREIFLQRDLAAVLQALSAGGVRALVIKGAALAYSVYDAAWQRPSIDTDILVAPDQAAAAEQVLGRAGYRQSHALTSGELVSHQVSFERDAASGLQHVIDLHWKIVNPQMLADSLPFEDLWTDAVTVPRLGPDARMPSPIASVILASIHRLAHHQGRDRLIWLYDLRLLAGRLERAQWDSLVQAATARRVAGLCLDGLRQARDQVAAPLPADVERTLEANAPGEPSHRYLEGIVSRRQVLADDLAALGSWRARLRLIREHAFPPPAYIRERYGITSRWLLPALYVHRLLAGARKWVRS